MVPDETAHIGSGSILYDSILRFVSNVRQLFATDDFSRRHFSDASFLGAFRVKLLKVSTVAFLQQTFKGIHTLTDKKYICDPVKTLKMKCHLVISGNELTNMIAI